MIKGAKRSAKLFTHKKMNIAAKEGQVYAHTQISKHTNTRTGMWSQ